MLPGHTESNAMASNPRLGAIIRPLQLIWLSIQRNSPSPPTPISADFIAFESTTIVPTLVHSARGRILELGPGPGNQLQRFSPSHVTTIFGVEPNPYYGSFIAAKLEKLNGLRDKYELLTCGVEDSDVLRAAGVEEGGMDAVVSVQVLCAVRDLV
ncbi:putative methyltransferase type 11 [Diplodia seriata]|uniref:Putative methyltransferase type 11 n=1 Tax=Diplodia seriata TaxID=420778 RepID=A0A0G2DTD3_9PEZI|nr:putative methyltransferase type 11 [Diplodia seriata]